MRRPGSRASASESDQPRRVIVKAACGTCLGRRPPRSSTSTARWPRFFWPPSPWPGWVSFRRRADEQAPPNRINGHVIDALLDAGQRDQLGLTEGRGPSGRAIPLASTMTAMEGRRAKGPISGMYVPEDARSPSTKSATFQRRRRPSTPPATGPRGARRPTQRPLRP
jgi:hypothetical protein